MRLFALRALAELGDAEALARSLRGPDRIPAAWALARLGPSALPVVAPLKSSVLAAAVASWWIRRRERAWKVRPGRPQCLRALRQAEHPLARFAHADRLVSLHGEHAIPPLLELLREDPELGGWALGQLGRVALPEMLDAFRSGSRRVREGILTALWYLGSDARPAEALVADHLPVHPDLCEAVLLNLGSLELARRRARVCWLDEQAVTELALAAFGEEVLARREAVRLLGWFGPARRQAVAVLSQLTGDPELHDGVVQSLSRHFDVPAAVRPLMPYLREAGALEAALRIRGAGDVALRQAREAPDGQRAPAFRAARVLAPNLDVVPFLKDPEVRPDALTHLMEDPSPGCLPRVLECLPDPLAFAVLGEIGHRLDTSNPAAEPAETEEVARAKPGADPAGDSGPDPVRPGPIRDGTEGHSLWAGAGKGEGTTPGPSGDPGQRTHLLEELRRWARDPQPGIRGAAAAALSRLGSVDELLAALGDSDESVRSEATWALRVFPAEVGDAVARGELVNRQVLTAMDRLAPREQVETWLERAMLNAARDLRPLILTYLKSLASLPSPILIELLGEADADTACDAARVLLHRDLTPEQVQAILERNPGDAGADPDSRWPHRPLGAPSDAIVDLLGKALKQTDPAPHRERLIAWSRSDVARLARLAVSSLGELKDPPVEELTAALRHHSDEVVAEAVGALERVVQDLDQRVDCFRDCPRSLAFLTDYRVLARLLPGRLARARLLKLKCVPEELLGEIARGECYEAEVLSAVAEIDPGKARSALAQAYAATPPGGRRRDLAVRLARLETLAPVQDGLRSHDEGERREAAADFEEAFRHYPRNSEVIAAWSEWLPFDYAEVVRGVGAALVTMDRLVAQRSKPALLTLTHHANGDLVASAVMALGRLEHDEDVRPRLLDLLEHPDPVVRRKALLALRRQKMQPERIRALLADPDAQVLGAAIRVLNELEDLQEADLLEVLPRAQELEDALRGHALDTLRRCSHPDLRELYRSLRRLGGHPDD
ncbi:MAG: HEAT repeat domain-containing protein [Candidatus Eremiobacterota bacterium]